MCVPLKQILPALTPPSTTPGSEDMKLNYTTLRTPEGLTVKGQKAVGHLTSVICLLQSCIFPSECCFSCIPSSLAWCTYFHSYLLKVCSDFCVVFSDPPMYIAAFTHFYSSWPILTEPLLSTRHWPRHSFRPQGACSPKGHPPSSRGRQTRAQEDSVSNLSSPGSPTA